MGKWRIFVLYFSNTCIPLKQHREFTKISAYPVEFEEKKKKPENEL
jgi:hypothetical protein